MSIVTTVAVLQLDAGILSHCWTWSPSYLLWPDIANRDLLAAHRPKDLCLLLTCKYSLSSGYETQP